MLNAMQRDHLIIIVAGLLASLFLCPAALAAGLSDTGQSLCYDGSALVACTADNTGDAATYPRQDGRYGRDAAATAGALTKIGGGAAGFDFTRICNNGDAEGSGSCPANPAVGLNPTNWGCTRDNTTGLTWEVKVNDNSQLRHQGHTYTWYQDPPFPNGGNAGAAGSTTSCNSTLTNCNTQDYTAAINNDPNGRDLCNQRDWRLPSVRELLTLVHYGVWSPAIDTAYFPNTVASNFWSASSNGPSPTLAWFVDFSAGFLYVVDKTNTLSVRLVRGGQL